MHAQAPRRIYEGKIATRDNGQHLVTVNGVPLRQRPDLSGGIGFAWGYGGGGPTQLSIALLADAFDDIVAKKWNYIVKNEIVSKLDQKKGWVLTEYDLWFLIHFHSPEGERMMAPYTSDKSHYSR